MRRSRLVALLIAGCAHSPTSRREQFLADAARHYRAYLRGAPATYAAERERAAAFLQSYAVPPTSEQQ